MYIFLKIFILLYMFSNALEAKEPFLATLTNVVSNDIQEFRYANTKFSCLPYGIIALDEMYRKADEESACKKSIAKFYTKRQDLLYYAQMKLLKLYQRYSIRIKDKNRCVINVAGEKTLSEFLIEEGLAVEKPLFKDKEYSYYFYRSEQKARVNLKGAWKEKIIKDCVAYIYTQEQLEQMK